MVLKIPAQDQVVPLLWTSDKDSTSWQERATEQTTYMMNQKAKRERKRLGSYNLL